MPGVRGRGTWLQPVVCAAWLPSDSLCGGGDRVAVAVMAWGSGGHVACAFVEGTATQYISRPPGLKLSLCFNVPSLILINIYFTFNI